MQKSKNSSNLFHSIRVNITLRANDGIQQYLILTENDL